MFGFFLPAFFVVLGLAALLYPRQAGFIFCRKGKLIWRICTLGLTDMHWFYPEDNLPRVGRLIGMVLLLGGLPMAAFSAALLFPPNSFVAMSQAETYLHAKYGDSNGDLRMSCDATNESNNVVIQYTYSGKKGVLHASWDGKQYVFTSSDLKPQ